MGHTRKQAGAALLLMMVVMLLGTSWALVGAVNRVSRNTVNQETKTGESLRIAKQALLGYLAQQAASSDVPGKFPCPEALDQVGTANEGTTAGTCSTLPVIGRFPWKTLGIEKPLDGSGEALWYVVGSSVRTAPINFSTTGTLSLDGVANAVVAVIVAPGAPLDSASSSSTAPSPCVKRDQTPGRGTLVGTLVASDFVECGNSTMAAFVSTRNDSWGNDRVIAITAAEMMAAIEGPVGDRIQRTVAPQINGSPDLSNGWYQVKSLSEWGTKFFPYASTWGIPSSDDSCGDYGVTEGLLPLASGKVTTGTGCSSRWNSATISKVSGTGSFSAGSCTADDDRMTCSFSYNGKPVVSMTANAPNIAMGFRTAPTIDEALISPSAGSSVSSLSASVVTASGNGQVTLTASMRNRTGAGTTAITISIPHPEDSFLLNTDTGSNPNLAWFINNQWHRYTYYAISPAVTANPSGTCTTSIVTNCLSLTNAESGSGNINDKRIALILSGRPLTGKTYPSANRADYFELENNQTSTLGDRTFQRNTISATFNDRAAVCPYQRQTTGTANVLCD
jgi:hypothetical protein